MRWHGNLQGKPAIFAMCIGQLGNLLPHVAEQFDRRAAFCTTAFGPLGMMAVCLSLTPVTPKATPTTLLAFGPVLRNKPAMGSVLGYGARCFELYGIRTWLVAFWTFVFAHNGGAGVLTPVAVSFGFSVLAMPSSIMGNELALRFGRHRAVSVVMVASACFGLSIGAFARASPYALLASAPHAVRDHRAGRFWRADCGHGDVRSSGEPGRDDGRPLDRRLWTSALGTRCVGAALDASGGPNVPSVWFTAFAVLAAGILIGPLALRWSRAAPLPTISKSDMDPLK